MEFKDNHKTKNDKIKPHKNTFHFRQQNMFWNNK